jgi:drug/metabolite transporter (DMT)-like permease
VIDTALLAGFVLALLAACAYDSSYALQAFEARRAPPERSMRLSLLAHLLRRPIWAGAIALSIVGWVLQLLALSHAPLTLVQPVLALGLFLLLALGATLLDEPVGAREWAAVALIIVAVALISYGAPTESGTVPRDAGLAVAVALLVVLTLAPIAAAARAAPPVVLLIVGAGAADGLAAFVTKIVSEEAGAGNWLLAAAWGAGAGLAVLAGLLSESSALQRAAATRVAPAVLVLQIAIPVVLAPLVGGESWSDTPLGGALLGFALGLLSLGVLVLAGSRAVSGVLAEPGPPNQDGQSASAATTAAAAGNFANE